MNPSRSFLDKFFPRYTLRRLLVTMIRRLPREPLTILRRLNSENLFLYRSFRLTTAHCIVCGRFGSLFYDMPDPKIRREHGIGLLRETLNCKSCGSTLRQRALARVFLDEINSRTKKQSISIADLANQPLEVRVLDTDNFSPMSRILAKHENYIRSIFDPTRAFGDLVNRNLFNVDLQEITFPDKTFDIILTSDVMEHIENDVKANQEIARCLKPEGAYIFTVPYNENMARNEALILNHSGDIHKRIFLRKKHYHGDPLTGGILAWRIYGREIFDDFARLGLTLTFHYLMAPEQGLFSGDVFTAKH